LLYVRLLGAFEISRGDQLVVLPSRPAQSLFAYLLLNAGTSHRREKLAGMFWPDSLEETARDNLRHALWRVRKALESASALRFLHADDLTISFAATSDYWLDAAILETLPENALVDELTAALSEYRGELLPGFYDEWVVLEREHVHSIFEHHMARLMSLLQAEKRWLEVLDWGERWISLGQKPEPAFRALMSAHAAKGDMSRVATTYERCVKSLSEFGIEPSEQTHGLYERLRAGTESFQTEPSFPVIGDRKESQKTNLPIPLTSFIGRQREIEEVVRLLNNNRLVTLMGSGGVGKTRLAIESGNRLLPRFKDGVWWVDLVGLADLSLVPQAVAKVLGARELPNQPMIETLAQHLASKQLLIMLDNCEHLISACAELTDRLLGASVELKILTTSREALDILGETTLMVPSMSLPEIGEALVVRSLKQFESVRLFGERAQLVQPAFELNGQNANAVVQICRRLSGIPLAIELAAARVKIMSVDEIANRLDNRFSLLTSGSRTALPRHQTLRAAIDWSYELLTDAERILFHRLAVFVGGFTLDAGEAVCGFGELQRIDVVDLLGRLVDKSLVVAEVANDIGTSRFRLLETIRQYAREQFNEAEAAEVHKQHLEFYANLAEEAEPQLELVNQGIWLDKLEAEMDNFRAAIDWAVTNDRIVSALRLIGALRRFWVIRSHDAEGLERIRSILDLSEAQGPSLAFVKTMNAYFFILWPSGGLREQQNLIESAINLSAELGDPRNEAFALLWAGVSATEQGDYSRARSYLEQSQDKWPDNGRSADLALSRVFLGEIAMFEGDSTRAEGLFEGAISPFREVHDFPFIGMVFRRLGQIALKKGQLDSAFTYVRQSLGYNWKVQDYRGVGACLAAFAALSIEQRKSIRAAELFGAVDAVLETTHIPLLRLDQYEYERNLGRLRAKIDDKTFMKFWGRGRAMTIEKAIALALEEK